MLLCGCLSQNKWVYECQFQCGWLCSHTHTINVCPRFDPFSLQNGWRGKRCSNNDIGILHTFFCTLVCHCILPFCCQLLGQCLCSLIPVIPYPDLKTWIYTVHDRYHISIKYGTKKQMEMHSILQTEYLQNLLKVETVIQGLCMAPCLGTRA